MKLLEPIEPSVVAKDLANNAITLIDVRETCEHELEHIAGSDLVPLSAIHEITPKETQGKPVVFYCRSGNRTDVHCDKLRAFADDNAKVMKGGILEWKAQGLPTVTGPKEPIEINRQVQIAAGTLVLLGALLGMWVHPGFYGLCGIMGSGLIFAGLTGHCPMARILMAMPWNRTLRR